jgi:Holliday junction DNA helicase RuvB
MLTAIAFQHLGKSVPQGFVGMQASLFQDHEEQD